MDRYMGAEEGLCNKAHPMDKPYAKKVQNKYHRTRTNVSLRSTHLQAIRWHLPELARAWGCRHVTESLADIFTRVVLQA